jgi:hypothetical protein
LNFSHVRLRRPERRVSHFCQIRGTW